MRDDGRGHRTPVPQILLLAVVIHSAAVTSASAFVLHSRWTTTASGVAGPVGSPLTLTWSLVPDGTTIADNGPSNLISMLDTSFGAGPGGDDLTQRPWFTYFAESFGRWNELSGVQFVYEPNDDRSTLTTSNGMLGVRGDVRLGGVYVDGNLGTLAYTFYPNDGDMVLDTADSGTFANSASDYLKLRNILTHELGHAIGLDHVKSSDGAFLMETDLTTAFDGPQLDDICGLQWYYGDALEKSNDGAGNGTAGLATDLGAILPEQAVTVGADAGPDLVVSATDVDFVSITNADDLDFYSFTVSQPLDLSAVLTPLGGVFHQAPVGSSESLYDASAQNDLSLVIFGSDGTSALAADGGPGEVESLSGLSLPAAGRYFAQVSGASDNLQLYRLDLSVALAALAGDFNGDGLVDAADYTVWRDTFGETGPGLAADANGDLVVNDLDYAAWKQNFGATAANGHALLGLVGVPEPASLVLALIGALAASGGPGRRRAVAG